MNPTRATPIMSAAAVADVRLGLRRAFSWARCPAVPDTARAGMPSTRSTGRASTGPSTNTPSTVVTAPRASIWSARFTVAGDPRRRGEDASGGDCEAGDDPLDGQVRAVDGDVAQGGDRGDPAGPQRRGDRRGDGDDDADDDRRDDRRGRDDGRARRDVETDLGEQLAEPERHPDPEAEAGGAGDEPDGNRFEQHRAQDLPAAGADGTQHGQVAGALGDHDRERVVDDEHPDEQRDVGEREEERVEELQVLAQVGLLVGGVGLAGQHLDLIVGECRLQAHSQLVGADVGRTWRPRRCRSSPARRTAPGRCRGRWRSWSSRGSPRSRRTSPHRRASSSTGPVLARTVNVSPIAQPSSVTVARSTTASLAASGA